MNVQPYNPSDRFKSTNGLLTNHFRFQLEALPDLTYFAQSVTIPSVTASSIPRATPLTRIKEAGDSLSYGSINVSYLVDAAFKSYSSLYWWMKGYGFPHSNQEVVNFRELRAKRLPTPRPIVRELEKTSAALYILEPDTERILVEFRMSDVFPVALSELSFDATTTDAQSLVTTATFDITEFDVYLPE